MRSELSKIVESFIGEAEPNNQRLSGPICLAKSLIGPCRSSESTKPRSGFKPSVSGKLGLRKSPSTRHTDPGTLFANNLAVVAHSQLQPKCASIGANSTDFGAPLSPVRNKRCTSFKASS